MFTRMQTKLAETRNEDGFTLIELLVVILIIGILAAIAIPVFLNQQKAAKDASLKSDVRNLATVYVTYKADNPSSIYPDLYVNWGSSKTNADNFNVAKYFKTSEGTQIHSFDVSSYNNPEAKAGDNFCIQAAVVGGTYDGSSYSKYLFYDSRTNGFNSTGC